MRRTLSLLSMLIAMTTAGALADAPRVDFNRDIRPILSDTCFTCHGPDKETRKANLRLDVRESAIKKSAIVPGKPGESELIRRIVSTDPDEVMPPPEGTKKLKPQQVELLKRWIEQNAEYTMHWAFVPPKRPAAPEANDPAWSRNPIDRFILARLGQDGFKPSPQADRATLIRRLKLDLIGLPPTPSEIDEFLSDQSFDAYEKLVERLLASPHYGERMALEWLDAARFADTHGFHIDSGRDMTRWREWVIDAYNRNKPFDQFTVEQLAGDMLPDATLEQRIASGFNRNHMITFEGGAIPEEFQAAYVMDRVNTTGTVWLGLSVGCAQCHDHKYDPITQKDYYSLYAFFHNVPENPIDGRKGNAVPYIKAPTPEQEQALAKVAGDIQAAEGKLLAPLPEVDAAQAEWERTALTSQNVEWRVPESLEAKAAGGGTFARQEDQSLLISGANPATETYTVTLPTQGKPVTALKLEALPHPSLNSKGPGRSDNGNFVLTEVRVAADGKPFKLRSVSAAYSQDGFAAANAIDGKQNTGWAIYPQSGKAHSAIFMLEQPAAGSLTITFDFKSAYAQHQFARFRLSVTDAAHPDGGKKLPGNIAELLAIGPAKRTQQHNRQLAAYYRSEISDHPALKAARDELRGLKKQQSTLDASVRTTMVMQELPKPRDTHILMRGQYDKKGAKVAAALPAFLSNGQPSGDRPLTRLDLARWLVAPENPLTARVTVNRFWQMYFGTGLVKTSDDFGSQGEWPSHPELLDFLATEFVRSGWDVKAMQRLIVTSAAYRQSSRVTPELLARDPENRLLARGPRFRLSAEFIRDQALALSGLLNPQIGGRSVSPYQPAGLWEELMSRADGQNWTAQVYVQDHGPDLYRRTMYTFWKRTSPPPALSTFDAPDREICTVRRLRTNTPLQALVLMNDPTYVEASRKLAERMMASGGQTPDERIAFAFRLATARPPKPAELAVLRRIFDQQLAVYRQNPEAAKKLLGVGESPRDEKLEATELAAWTIVSSSILNLDEVVTKN